MFKIALDRMQSDSYNIIIKADKTPGEHTRKFNSPIIYSFIAMMNYRTFDLLARGRWIQFKYKNGKSREK